MREFDHAGHRFCYDEGFVWAPHGELHEHYAFWAECRKSENDNLWEVRRVNAAETILRKWEEWAKQADASTPEENLARFMSAVRDYNRSGAVLRYDEDGPDQ